MAVRAIVVAFTALFLGLSLAGTASAEPLKSRPIEIVTQVEKCEMGCGEDVAVTRRVDDGATRLSTIRDGRPAPGDHIGVYH